jgi:hypothetical protein
MTTSSTYARFDCRICGETVYSLISKESQEGGFFRDRTLELTCSSGHTDQYRTEEVVLVAGRPAGALRMRHAMVAGG